VISERLEALGIRPVAAAEATELHALVEGNREHLARWLPWAAGQDLAATEAFIAKSAAQLAGNDGFQARIAPEGAILGIVGFHSVDWVNRSTAIGYWLAEPAQGRGLMTAAVRAMVDHAFGEWDLHRVEIRCAPGNLRSRAVPERLGFREEAILRDAQLIAGHFLDSVVYGLLQGEWEPVPIP
jgi:ribosomal-protein-serine acetyltransferase